jgi:hypothetical protein
MKFNCPECSHEIKIPDRYAGHVGTCNHCQAKIRVPSGFEVQSQKVVHVATVLMDVVAPIKSCKKCGATCGAIGERFCRTLEGTILSGLRSRRGFSVSQMLTGDCPRRATDAARPL